MGSRNGAREDFHTQGIRDGIRTYFGSANRYLDVGCANEGPFELWLSSQVKDERTLQDDVSFDALMRGLSEHQYFSLVYRETNCADRVYEQLKPLVKERTLRGIGIAVLEMTASHMTLPHLGHEDPLLIDDLAAVHRIFPDMRLIQIIRDPRDVALSILKFPWGANNVVVAADDWDRKVAAAKAFGASLGPARYHELRYEDLLAAPRETMGQLMEFTHGVIDSDRLSAYVRETESNPRRNNSCKWKQQFSTRHIAAIEGCAAGQMTEYGYELSTAARHVSRLRRSAWRLHHRVTQVTGIARGALQSNGQAHVELQPS